MRNVIEFPRKTGRWFRQPAGYHDRYSSKSVHSGVSLSTAGMVWALVVACVFGFYYLRSSGELDRLTASLFTKDRDVAMTSGDTLTASFSICYGAVRINCVVDGDTFWFQGNKIRIADIDTPELSPPRCVREARLGEAAKSRLLALLNAGRFSLMVGQRDEDRYRRKLRTVYRNGQSIGDILVAEGLARRWEGSRRSWCG